VAEETPRRDVAALNAGGMIESAGPLGDGSLSVVQLTLAELSPGTLAATAALFSSL
jgi:hypothetical protein